MFPFYNNQGIIPSLTQPGKTLAPSLAPAYTAPKTTVTAPAAAPVPVQQQQQQQQQQQDLPPPPPVYDPAAAAAAASAAREAAEAAERKAIMDASVSAINQNIGSLATRKTNTYSGIDERYASILEKYADQEAQNDTAFTNETGANEGTYSRNQSLALQAAASGRQSLFANLGAIGAVGPSAMKLANRAVAKSANSDIGEASRTFETNATTLTTANDKRKQDETNRKLEAEAARKGEKQSADYDYTEALQKAYSDIASAYATGKNLGGATDYTAKAGSLYSQLAANTKPVTPAYQTRDIALDTSKLGTYLAGQKSNAVVTKGGNSATAMNSPIYALARRREELV